MKRILGIVIAIVLCFGSISCLDDEPTVKVTYLYTPIDSIQIGEIQPARQVTEIKTFFTKSSDCETFFDYDYQISGNERTVSMVLSEVMENTCIDITEVDSNTLQFKPENSGLYTFRFWSGNDENNEPIFIIQEIEIP